MMRSTMLQTRRVGRVPRGCGAHQWLEMQLMMPVRRRPSCVPRRRAAGMSTASASTSRDNHDLSIAIVGSGPSGCYTAKYLQSSLRKLGRSCCIHVLERLPTPYGLVRYGVAPDHPEVKNVQHDFDELFENNHIRFHGNVCVGKDVSVAELRTCCHAVVLAYGCESDRRLAVPGHDLPGILSAREFVAWYNGHPDFVHIGEQVEAALGRAPWTNSGVRDAHVVVIGQGNVALDCARILAKGQTGLYHTDLAAHALPILGEGVAHTSIVGRRGHVQGAFTIKELRELVKLEADGHGATFLLRHDELELGTTDATRTELNEKGARPKQRIDKLLHETAANQSKHSTCPKTVELRFLLSPAAYHAGSDKPRHLELIRFERTTLEGDTGSQRAVGTGAFETLKADLALVSIGYTASALPGLDQYFDADRGVIRNSHGLVDAATSTQGGLYAAGWVKRGATGIIGTNIVDAKDTVARIVHDLSELEKVERTNDIPDLLSGKHLDVVTWEGYKRIEDAESRGRRSPTQPREKITDTVRQLAVACSA